MVVEGLSEDEQAVLEKSLGNLLGIFPGDTEWEEIDKSWLTNKIIIFRGIPQ